MFASRERFFLQLCVCFLRRASSNAPRRRKWSKKQSDSPGPRFRAYCGTDSPSQGCGRVRGVGGPWGPMGLLEQQADDFLVLHVVDCTMEVIVQNKKRSTTAREETLELLKKTAKRK